MSVDAKIQTTMKFQERDLLAIMAAIIASSGVISIEAAVDNARYILRPQRH